MSASPSPLKKNELYKDKDPGGDLRILPGRFIYGTAFMFQALQKAVCVQIATLRVFILCPMLSNEPPATCG